MDIQVVDFAETAARTRSARTPSPAEIVFGQTSVFLDGGAPVADAGVAARRTAKVQPGKKPHVVVQKGRSFQIEHPDVNVLLDRGRFLLVELSGADRQKIDPNDSHFGVLPAEGGRVVYAKRAAAPAAAGQVARAAAPLARLSETVFRSALTSLTSIHSRLSASDGYREAADFCAGELENRGYAVTRETFSVPGLGETHNVVARKAGATSAPRIVVTAHLDSVNHPGGPDAAAPGADDNGSGSAGVLALADALAGNGTCENVLFVLFGGEEQGLFGSRHHVQQGDHFDGAALKAVINMDMIASINPPDDPNATNLAVLLEGAEVSRPVVEALAQAAATHTSLDVSTSFNPFASDHVPFIQAGLPALLTIEGGDSSNNLIHTGDDRLEHIDVPLAMEILKMNLAGIVEYIGAPGGTA